MGLPSAPEVGGGLTHHAGFRPISSLFDFLTFGLMLAVLHAGAIEFRTGWFVESLATQTLIIFAIRTRKVPFFCSRPSILLAIAVLTVVTIGFVLTISPLADGLGFTPLPWQFIVVLGAFVVAYLALVELAKVGSTPERRTWSDSPIALVDAPISSDAAPHAFTTPKGTPPRI